MRERTRILQKPTKGSWAGPPPHKFSPHPPRFPWVITPASHPSSPERSPTDPSQQDHRGHDQRDPPQNHTPGRHPPPPQPARPSRTPTKVREDHPDKTSDYTPDPERDSSGKHPDQAKNQPRDCGTAIRRAHRSASLRHTHPLVVVQDALRLILQQIAGLTIRKLKAEVWTNGRISDDNLELLIGKRHPRTLSRQKPTPSTPKEGTPPRFL